MSVFIPCNIDPDLTETGSDVADFVFVDNVTDFPGANAGVITLANNTTYFLTTSVDLGGSRLVGGQNTCILGSTSETCILSSTGLAAGTAIITSAWSLPMRHLALTHGTALDLDASGNSNQALDWYGVNFLNCATIGTIANYNNAIFTSMAWLNSENLTFDGSFGTIALETVFMTAFSGGTCVAIAPTCTVTRRFRINESSIVVGSGSTGVNVSTSATIPVEGYIVRDVNFSGSGTYTTGVLSTDNKALFVDVKGVENSASTGYLTMVGNATATTIATQGVAVKAAGTTTFQSDVSQKFTHADNRLTYVGAITKRFRILGIVSMLAPNNTRIGTYIAKNGVVVDYTEIYTTADGNSRAENVSVQAIMTLEENDYIELWVENDSSTSNITAEDLSLIVEEV